jgi:nicotinamidase-related amidase
MVRGIVFALAAVEPPRQKISRPACQHRIRGGYCNAPRSARDPEGGWVARNCSALMEVFLKTPFTLKGANSPGRSGMDVNSADAALVVIDPQNDVLSENGVSWSLVGASVTENNTVENIGRLFQTAKDNNYQVFISPHYMFPTDRGWRFGGPVEEMMLEQREFWRPDALSLDRFDGSGADWLPRYKPFIEDGKTVVVSPHKVWGPQTNDLVLQLRKRGIGKIVLAGMLANLCVESHLREFLEQGFEVAMVKDATAAPRHPKLGDGYKAAVINYGFLANAVLTTDEAVKAMK